MIKKILPFMKPWRTAAILCPILVLIETLADVMMPLLMAHIVDVGISTRDLKTVFGTGSLMIGLTLIALVCGAASSWLGSYASQGFGSSMRAALFDKIQAFSFSNLDKFTVPSLITRVTNDVNNQVQAALMSLRMLVRAPFMMILALTMVLFINPRLASVFLIAIPLLALSLVIIMTNAHPRFMALQKKLDELNTAVQENLVNIRVIKAFARSTHEKQRFANANDALTNSAMRAITLVILNGPVMQLIMYACILSILWYGGHMVSAGTLLSGQLISFITYVNQILMSLMMLSMLFLMFTRAKASVERIVEVLETEVDIQDPENGLTTVKDGSVTFRNVHFRYPANPNADILEGIDLSIHSGETIGILGPTGCGKTSLVQLIPRLYDASQGAVLVGGQDVRAYTLATLRDSVSVVLQKNTLFTGTIRENMKWGCEEATDDDIWTACASAQAAAFVRAMPEGLDTVLGQGGVNLSGGQKQRLCIARALLKNPKVLILDDSTSAVDVATDAGIREAFRTQLVGITTIIIAQRIRSISHADRILVLDDGKVETIGTHAELLAKSPIYQDIWQAQQEGSIAG